MMFARLDCEGSLQKKKHQRLVCCLNHLTGGGHALPPRQIGTHVSLLQISESQKDVGTNHAVSGLKFKILQRFLSLGYSVLLSDVDIIFLQDPFPHLFKDSDVESMSDGWDNQTAYGRVHESSFPAASFCHYPARLL